MQRKYFYLPIALFLFASSFPVSVFAAEECSNTGYTVFTINGVGTDQRGAEKNRDALKEVLGRQWNSQPLIVDYLHNPSHLGGIGDWLKAIEQGIFDSENLTDYDLTEMLLAASEKLKTQKVILVAHSQGNFYANGFYGAVADKEGGIPKQSISVYGVATPSSFVAGGGKYLTSETDKVIVGLVGRVHFRQVLSPNTNIELKEEDDPLGHSFSDIYLKYRAPRISREIQEALSGLKTNDTAGPGEPCLYPPELGWRHTAKGLAFAVSDPIGGALVGAIGGAVGFTAAAYDLAKDTAAAALHIVGGAINDLQYFAAQINPLNFFGGSQAAQFIGYAPETFQPQTTDIDTAPFQENATQGPAEDLTNLAIVLQNISQQVSLLNQQVSAFSNNQSQNNPVAAPAAGTSSGTPYASQPTQQASGGGGAESSNPPEPVGSSDPTAPSDDGAEPEPEPEPEEPPPAIVINEIAWMGTKASAQDEWIELYNNTDDPIDITGWQLVSSDLKPSITFATSDNTIIAAKGFYLIERTNDTTTSEPADAIKTFGGGAGSGLGNDNCEVLSLYNISGTLIDQTACANDGNWPAGNNDTKQTMERINTSKPGFEVTNWANNNLFTRNGTDAGGNDINGTPKKQNSVSASETIVTNVQLSRLFDEFSELTMTNLGSPYIIRSISAPPFEPAVPVGKILNIEAGITLRFTSDPFSSCPHSPPRVLKVEGTLNILGTEDSPVRLTSASDDDYWCGLQFTSLSADSQLNHLTVDRVNSEWAIDISGVEVEIRNLALTGLGNALKNKKGIRMENVAEGTVLENSTLSGFEDADNTAGTTALLIIGGSPLIINNSFQNNRYGAIVSIGSPIFEENVFENNRIAVQAAANASPSFSDSAAQNNILNGVEVIPKHGIAVTGNAVWSSDLPYVLEGTLIINPDASLELKPGMVVKRGANAVDLVAQGVLLALGTSENPIVFTALSDDEYGGDTNGDGDQSLPFAGNFTLELDSPNSSSQLENVVVRYGGRLSSWGSGVPPKGAIYITQGELSLIDSIIERNIRAGIEINGEQSDVSVLNTVFRQHHKYNNGVQEVNAPALVIHNVLDIQLESSTFEDNDVHFWWNNGGDECEDLVSSGSNFFDESGAILCEGSFP